MGANRSSALAGASFSAVRLVCTQRYERPSESKLSSKFLLSYPKLCIIYDVDLWKCYRMRFKNANRPLNKLQISSIRWG